MNINHELLQFYIYKKQVKRKDAPEILAEKFYRRYCAAAATYKRP